MTDFLKYLSTAPVALVLFSVVVVGVFIEINRFFPDVLVLP
jgi:hypothetical protein